MKKEEYDALLALEKGIGLTSQNVLDVARAKSSPLHRHFTWDDTEAAQLYRLRQAQGLIASFSLVVVNKPKRAAVLHLSAGAPGGGSGRSRAFVPSGDGPRNRATSFVARSTMLADHALRWRHIESVCLGIQGFLNTNRDIRELQPISDAVEQLLSDARRKVG